VRNNDNILRKAEIQNTHFHYKIALKEIICIAVAFYCQRNLCKAQENLKGIFNVHVTVHLVKFLKMKPTRCTNFSNLFLEWNSTCFGQFLCPSSGVFRCTHSNCICHTVLLTACEQDQDGTAVPSWSRSQGVSTTIWHTPLLCVHRKTPDDGQRNCPKHVEFHSKNKFDKIVHIVGFILTHCWRVTQICVFTLQLCRTGDADLRF